MKGGCTKEIGNLLLELHTLGRSGVDGRDLRGDTTGLGRLLCWVGLGLICTLRCWSGQVYES